MRSTPLLVVVCSACSFHGAFAIGDGGRDRGGDGDDAAIDAAADAIPDAGPGCFGTGFVQVCPTAMPTQGLTLSGTIDTDTSAMCAAFTSGTGTSACLIAGQSIAIGATFSATGTKPLVLLSTSMITIAGGGVLDVASHRVAGTVGAGGDSPLCIGGTDPVAGVSSGGGWGGSFGGKGGDGSAGNLGGSGGIAPSAAGAPTVLRGGCAGSAGAGTGAGTKGHGGGAVFLIAVTQIHIDGTINASGSAGGGATAGNNAGGGAAGSGGLIGLDAPMVTLSGTAKVFANGGGSGEGAGGSVTGGTGTESTSPTAGGIGGSGGGGGGDGGNGSLGAMLDGGPGKVATSSDGGGGGGGGAGVIKVFSPVTSGTASTSPAPS